MSCAKSVLPAYMAVSTGKPARLPCHSVQVDTAHLPPQTQSISRSPRHDPSVNRTAVSPNDAAHELALRSARVHDPPGGEGADRARRANFAGEGMHPHLDELRAERERDLFALLTAGDF